MKPLNLKCLLALLGTLAIASSVWGYTFITNGSGQQIVWNTGIIPMKVMADDTTVLTDGTTRAGAIVAAMQTWNAQINAVQFLPTIYPVEIGGNGNSVNEVFFSATPYGMAWDSNTLALTTRTYDLSDNHTLETDVMFNPAYAWDSYRGPAQAGPVYDLRRVALHELGHALGLDHPDDVGQSQVAIMNSTVSNIDALQVDDIAGAQSLYGVPAGYAAPAITSQPQPQSIYIGRSTTFNVTASGTAPLSYQWQVYSASLVAWLNLSNDVLYSGSNTATLTILGANEVFGANSHLDGTSYRCVVINARGSVTSDSALLTVSSPPPEVRFSPATQIINEGSSAVFRVGIDGTNPIIYQWQRLPVGQGTWVNLTETGIYHDPTTNFLTVSNAVLAMSGDQFRCVANNAGGTVTSAPAVLTVIPFVIPAITLQPQSQTVVEGTNLSFSVTATGAIPLTFLWQTSPAGSGSWSDLADSGDYSGTTTGTLGLVRVPFVLNGSSYRCLVSNPAGTIPTDAAVLTITPAAPIISGHSATRVVLNPGQSSTLSVTAVGVGSLSYQWDHSGHPVSGATGDALTLSNVVMADGGYYNVRVTDTVGTRRSVTIFVIVAPAITHIVSWGYNGSGQTNSPAGLTNAVALAASNNASLALRADGTVIGWGSSDQTTIPAGLNNVVAVAVGAFHSLALRSDGTVVSWGDSSYGLSTAAAGLTDVVAISAGVYYSMALKADGTVVAWGQTTTSTYQLTPPPGLTNVVAISGTSTTSLALKADGTVVAWGFNGDGQASVPVGLGDVVGIAAGTAHSLALQSNGTVVAWGSNSFGQTTVPAGLTNVVAIAANNVVSFALKSDGTLVGWGTDSGNQFSFPQTTVPAGLNGVIAVDTGFAHAIVLCDGPLVGPSIATQTPSQTVNSGEGTGFSVTLNGSAPFTYQWQRLRTGGDTWSDLSNSSGYSSVTEPNLSIALATLAMNGDQFRCVVSNVVGSRTSSPVTLTVVTAPGAPVITSDPQSVTVVPGRTASFTVVASAASTLSYRWQLLTPSGGIWGDVVNLEVWGGIPSPPLFNGISMPTLSVNTAVATPGALNGFQFRCVVSNLQGSTVSKAALLTLSLEPATFSGDLNGDGKGDLLLTNTSTGERGIWLMNGSGVSAAASLGILPLNWTFSVVGDFNGDGKSDIFLTNTATSERGIWFMNGTSISSAASLGLLSTDWTMSATGDFNGDGKSDIFLTNTVTHERGIWLMNGTGISAAASLGVLPTDWFVSGTGDFNADGKADILFTNTATGERAIWLMNGTSVSAGASLGVLALDWTFSGVGDFNGDGKADIFLTNTTTGERGIWLVNGLSISSSATLGVLPTAWFVSRIADFNGDGKADLFLTNTATGERGVWLMNGARVATAASLGILPTTWLIR